VRRAFSSFACALAACVLAACADPVDERPTVCGKGPTVHGIDVSYHQGAIDWPAVRLDGVEFAFVRATDGLDRVDPQFAENWSASRSQNILRGAYQFFRPAQDPVAQADLLLGMLAPSPGELPPVIVVEATDDLAPPEIASAVRAWLDRVRPAIGREPIIYTGFYFWRDEVGAPDLTASPLWHAQYTSATCANIAPPWPTWAFWQFTQTGRVTGISADVDIDRWNGTREELASFAATTAAAAAAAAE
jgi:lysozyme